jgi:hypothetical protein
MKTFIFSHLYERPVVVSATSVWERNFGAWARLIRDHGERPVPHFSDQSFLNFLFVKGHVPTASWPRELVVHVDWERAQDACLMHFPGDRKAHIARLQKVGARWSGAPAPSTTIES